MTSPTELQLDFNGLSTFADQADRIRGQWDGSALTLDPPIGLGDEGQLTDLMAEFTAAWTKAATSIDSFISVLSSMCRDSVARFQQTDGTLARQATDPDGDRISGHHVYGL
ncbi:hypothetical protein KGQ19_00735 [Catenulispora sp. NL8]|uniref:ESAT-6-like protein n=1 Tax=Catenulispora pinistramenti TaxID=2705254 RepID=A0ABS5KHC5_9ACTN|nr:hypothetical protein [Catenulispora pinistramenti]MBS2545385.1 hypothetical protein [Catenulispora pinistramenti]